jgi:hypothetical protein
MKCFITSCTRKTTNWYFKRCGLKKYGKMKCFISHVLEKQVTLHFKRCGLKKYGKTKCFITSCTRKASNVAFQTWFEKVWQKCTGKWNVIKRHVLEKQVTLHFKRCGLKKYGKMKCFITSCTRKVDWIVKWYDWLIVV